MAESPRLVIGRLFPVVPPGNCGFWSGAELLALIAYCRIYYWI